MTVPRHLDHPEVLDGGIHLPFQDYGLREWPWDYQTVARGRQVRRFGRQPRQPQYLPLWAAALLWVWLCLKGER